MTMDSTVVVAGSMYTQNTSMAYDRGIGVGDVWLRWSKNIRYHAPSWMVNVGAGARQHSLNLDP